VDDDNCEVCRKLRAQEERHDATEPDRPGHRWTA
jgi:hypothetical protein